MSTSAYDAWYNLLTPNEKTTPKNDSWQWKEVLSWICQSLGKPHCWCHVSKWLSVSWIWRHLLRMANSRWLPPGWIIATMNWHPVCRASTRDGGWHNGDSLFPVPPAHWLKFPLSTPVSADSISSPIRGILNNAFYVIIYQQPPFSKSADGKFTCESKMKPNGTRVVKGGCPARECNNWRLLAYVPFAKEIRMIVENFPCNRRLDLASLYNQESSPKEGHTLAELPMAKVFNETESVYDEYLWRYR